VRCTQTGDRQASRSEKRRHPVITYRHFVVVNIRLFNNIRSWPRSRYWLDELVSDLLGLTERKGQAVHEAVGELVEQRLEKA